MNIELIPVRLSDPGGPPRSEGVHLSAAIRSYGVSHGMLDPAIYGNIGLIELSGVDRWSTFDPVSQIRMSIGLAWEEWYVKQLEGVRFHPGEVCCQGIYCTPDGESLDYVLGPDDGELALAIHEIKATYKSVSNVQHDLEDQYLWITQTQCYCKAVGALTAYLHVLFICGDYMRPISPQLRCWRLDYTQDELDMKWDAILEHVQQQGALD